MGNCFSLKKKIISAEKETYATPYIPAEISKEMGGVEMESLENYSKSLLQNYVLKEGIAEGNHWSACRATGKFDKKQVSSYRNL